MRWLKRLMIFVVIVMLVAAAFGVYTVRRSFAQVRGELEIAGLNSQVEVIRDELGVPHIYADNQHDLFFAQGYTHAQDRFFQMDFWRHIGAGSLAEMFGSSQVETDMFLRSLGFEALAEEEWAAMPSPGREVLESYAAGVNAYLDTHSRSEISLEYAILPLQNSEYEIEQWRPVDTLMWGKVMSWDLSGNMADELTRALLGRHLPPDRIAQLFPEFPEEHPVVVEGTGSASLATTMSAIPEEAVASLDRARAAANGLWEMTGGGFEGIGSNNWVVAGDLTVSGMPLLANDTHLAIQIPSIWYENGLHCNDLAVDCPYQVVGYSFAGTPGIVIGHNAHHAWGVTTEAADTQDLFIEKVNPDDPGQYEIDGAWVDFEVRQETIVVGGGDDLVFEVRSTRHGPVISETYLNEEQFDDSGTVDLPDDYVVALAWQTLEPSTIVEAILGMNTATSYEEFSAAVAKWDIAAQNVVYADIEGNIAYQSTGEIPVRAAGEGLFPVPGWTSEYEWTGMVPVEEMPSMLNPPGGFIQSANQPVLRPGSEQLIGIDADYGYRGARISALIEEGQPHDIASMQSIQLDSRDGSAEFLVPHLTALDTGGDPDLADTQLRLEGWATGSAALQADGRSTGAAVYMAIWRQVLALTFQDDMPEDFWPSGDSRWFQVVANLLESPFDPYWDDQATQEVETRDDILLEAMRLGRLELIDLLGDDPVDWTWGALHIANFENQSLGQSGIGPVEWLFNRSAPTRVGGSASLVNAIGWNTALSYDVDWVPSQRMVVDLANLDSSTFIHTTGQSGHAFAANYDSMIEMWVDGVQAPMPFTRTAVEAVAANTLIMIPPG